MPRLCCSCKVHGHAQVSGPTPPCGARLTCPCSSHNLPQVWPIWEAGWVEGKLPPWQEEERVRQQQQRHEEQLELEEARRQRRQGPA